MTTVVRGNQRTVLKAKTRYGSWLTLKSAQDVRILSKEVLAAITCSAVSVQLTSAGYALVSGQHMALTGTIALS